MLRRVAHMIAPHQLVPTVHVDMVLVTVMALAVLLGPPRLDILLAPLCRLVLPGGLSSRLLRCLGTATIEAYAAVLLVIAIVRFQRVVYRLNR